MKIGLVGYGKMGQAVKQAIDETDGMECVGIVSVKHMKDLAHISEKPDAFIEFFAGHHSRC